MVQLPPGAVAGQQMVITSPITGQQMTVVVPQGVPPGGQFRAQDQGPMPISKEATPTVLEPKAEQLPERKIPYGSKLDPNTGVPIPKFDPNTEVQNWD